jgi:hypothetical protein
MEGTVLYMGGRESGSGEARIYFEKWKVGAMIDISKGRYWDKPCVEI